MFLYCVKIEELDAIRLVALQDGLARGEENLRAQCPIREMSVVADGRDKKGGELDIYLALEDFVESEQLERLAGELSALIGADAKPSPASQPRVHSELIQI